MGKRVTFSVSARTTATPEVVYRLLATGVTWPEWSPIGSFRLGREGSGGGETVGAIRVFKTGTVTSREELLELRPLQGISYSALSGLPIRAHRADVEIERSDRSTAIEWREDFETKYPGTAWLVEHFLRHFVQRCADGLARHAADLPAGEATTADHGLEAS